MSNDLVSGCRQEDVSMDCVSVCNICGQSHDTNDCLFLEGVQYVSDTPIMSRARQSLPKNLEIVHMADESTTVITKVNLKKGTTFGPLHAKRMTTMNPLSEFSIKVFGNEDGEMHYLDFSNENYSNWMCFIAPASNEKEQNLVCYQVKQSIFYTAMRSISAGEEIRVWYAPYYAYMMKMPLYNKTFAIYNNIMCSKTEQLKTNQVQQIKQYHKDRTMLLSKEIAEELANKLPAQHLGAATNTEIWNCKFCLATTKSVISYAKHLMEHYKPVLGIFCNICNKKCNNASVLKRHKRIKHTHVSDTDITQTLGKEVQSQNSQATCLLRPHDPDREILDTKKNELEKLTHAENVTNNILDVCSLPNDKEQKSGLSVLDSNFITVSDLLKNDKDFSKNLGLNTLSESVIPNSIVNSDEIVPQLLGTEHEKFDNLDCDICDKKFDKVDYLYRHLRKHTGEFICPSCLVVFARKENLLSHACLSQDLEYNYECSFCQKLFLQKKYLKRHMAKHNEINSCKWCHHVFSSVVERTTHTCATPHYMCELCKKGFIHKSHLNRHIKVHNDPKPVRKRTRKKKEESTSAICEKCGDIFRNSYTLKQHLHTHGERMFECNICHSRFHRMAVLKEHKTIHENAQIPCNICGKRLKSKKALDIHMLLHGNKKHQCDKCDKSFFQKCNYLKHYKHVHEDKITYRCPHCSVVFTNKQNFDKHVINHVTPAEYSCALCNKSFHKEYQLKRHIQTSHNGIIYRCPFCHMTARHRHSIQRHFERQHDTLRQDWDKIGFINQLAEKTPLFIIEETNVQQQHNISEESYADGDSNEFEHSLIQQDTATNLCRLMNEDKITQDLEQTGSNKQTEITNSTEENEEVIGLMGSVKEPLLATNNPELNEVPQLTMNEVNDNMNETGLGNSYIYDDDGGDIMFYVLH